MPSPARAEALGGIVEVIDGGSSISPDNFGNEPALKARSHNLHRLSQMGPPDIVYVRKRFTPVMGSSRVYGYYHFVRGVDVASAASISAYIVDLVNNGLDALPWVNSGSWEIVGATYRTYNAISKVDVIVDFKLPGGISASAIDSEENHVDLTDAIWRETAVCAAIRDMTGTGEHPLYPCLRVIQSPAEGVDEAFLENAQACVTMWHNAGCDDSAKLNPSIANSRVATSISEHLLSLCRYDRAAEFFASEAIREASPDCVVHAAAAYRLKKDLNSAMSLIESAIATNSNSSMAFVGKAKILATRGDLEDAWDAAKKATECKSVGLSAWITLADLSADLARYREALVALNTGDMPQLVLDYYLRELVPNRRNTTTPNPGFANGCDAVNVLAQRLREERNMLSSRADVALSELPGKLMTPAEHECYSVLVKILSDVGWDRLLAIRGEAFVMETDIENEHPDAEVERRAGDDAQPPNSTSNQLSESDDGNAETNGAAGAPVHTEAGTNADTNADADADADVDADAEAGSEGLSDVPISTPTLRDETNGAFSEEERRKRSLEQSGKIVCKPWLDYLVTIMYEDLRAMAVWNAEERMSSMSPVKGGSSGRSSGQSANGSSVGGEPVPDVEAGQEPERLRRTVDEVAATTARPAVDWLRRGDLALRLQKVEEAKSAYWTCVKLSAKAKVPAVSAHISLMNLASKDGDAATTFRCVDAIWRYLDNACDRKSTSETTPPVIGVRRAVYNLIAKLGLRNVREALAKLDVDRNRIDGILLDAVSWNVDGFSI